MDTSGSHIGCNQDLDASPLKPGHETEARFLGQVTGDPFTGEPVPFEFTGKPFNPCLGIEKDEDATPLLSLQESKKQAQFFV
jgi:hypothetical protein